MTNSHFPELGVGRNSGDLSIQFYFLEVDVPVSIPIFYKSLLSFLSLLCFLLSFLSQNSKSVQILVGAPCLEQVLYIKWKLGDWNEREAIWLFIGSSLFFNVEREQPYTQAYSTVEKTLSGRDLVSLSAPCWCLLGKARSVSQDSKTGCTWTRK